MAVQRISVEGDPENACSTAAVLPPPPLPALMATQNAGAGPGPNPGSSSGTDDGQGEDEGCEHSFGPFDVDLAGSALDGGVRFAFDAPIPTGTYQEIAIRVDTVPASRAGGNPVLLDLAAAHASILVDGFVDGVTTFVFSTPLEVTQKREGKIVIGSGSNVTLDFDPSHWFDGPSGRLDPTSADTTVKGAILANIRASIRILKDDDRDGRDDDMEGSGGAGHK
jgi:hypothetical protein